MKPTSLLLIAALATPSIAAEGEDCDPNAEVVADLRTAVDSNESSEAQKVDSVENALSPAGGPIPDESQNNVAERSRVDWANQFFMTQIYDPQWNASGNISDINSNNCGPASLSMLMTSVGISPIGLEAETAIDYARASMYPSYPAIDASELPEGASLYVAMGLILVDDDAHSVYFDLMEKDPSLAQGISHTGAVPVFGYSWSELDTLVQSSGAVIAHGHITEGWVGRFPGEYGAIDSGTVPHFIALFPGSKEGEYVVSDPMHKGGAVLMGQQELQSFFQSPANPYETAIRVVTWDSPPNTR